MTRVYLSIGSNIERDRNVRGSIERLDQLYSPLILSGVYQSRAIGFDGADFYNMAVGLDTEQSLQDLHASLRRIEDEHGRQRRAEKFSSRPLDIDLLLFGDLVRHTPQFDIPRVEIERYAFVLLPLSEIAADVIHPETGKSIRHMQADLDAESQSIAKIDFDFGKLGYDRTASIHGDDMARNKTGITQQE